MYSLAFPQEQQKRSLAVQEEKLKGQQSSLVALAERGSGKLQNATPVTEKKHQSLAEIAKQHIMAKRLAARVKARTRRNTVNQ